MQTLGALCLAFGVVLVLAAGGGFARMRRRVEWQERKARAEERLRDWAERMQDHG